VPVCGDSKVFGSVPKVPGTLPGERRLLHDDRVSRVKSLRSTKHEKPYYLRERHYSGANLRKRGNGAGGTCRHDDNVNALNNDDVNDAIDNAVNDDAFDNNAFDVDAEFEPLYAAAQYNDAGHDDA
jgi:hypothetical protein